jgi:hypothetical protein
MADSTNDTVDNIKQTHEKIFLGAGGTPGGTGLFNVGLILTVAGLYLLLSNTTVSTAPLGWIAGGLQGFFRGFGVQTFSSGVIFVPFFIGVVILFYNSRLWSGWILFWGGMAVIVIEIISRLQFFFNQINMAQFLMMLAMVAAGIGCMLRSMRNYDGPTKN